MQLSDYRNKARMIEHSPDTKQVKVAFLSNFTINGLPEILKVNCAEEQLYAATYLAPYNQYMQEIINPQSGLYTHTPDIIFIVLDAEQFFGDYVYFPYRMDADQRRKFIETKWEELRNLLTTLQERTTAKIVVHTFPIPTYSSRGILELKEEFGFKESIHTFNAHLASFSREHPQMFAFDTNEVMQKKGLGSLHDTKMNYLADMKLSPEGLITVAEHYMSYMYPLSSKTKKCLMLDLDDTLWGGVIGEDGINGIKLGQDKEGKPFLDFQRKILELFERGFILAVNSKNNPEDALEAIRNHPHMVLREKHFACFRMNWQDKATNAREIAQELNIGLDSLVFFDNDETNREIMRQFAPDVTVVEMPVDPASYVETIEQLPFFNTFSITTDDLRKGEMYVQQRERRETQGTFTNVEDFLKQLQIKLQINDAHPGNIPRISQLTQKTNQFNLTTKRYLEENITQFAEQDDTLVKCIAVRDKFGEYGTTGVAIVKKNDSLWEIDTFLLSCRVLGKNIEYSLMNKIIEDAQKEGVTTITASFIPTKKNIPAKGFLNECGFQCTTDSPEKQEYVLKVGEQTEREIGYIEVL